MMSRTSILSLALAFLIPAPASAATPFSFEGPGEDASLFSIGWSKNEARFAYGFFATTSLNANGSMMAVVIQDLRTDKVLFSKVKIWDEGNVGGGVEGYYPKSGQEAYGRLSRIIGKRLKRLKISVPAQPVQRAGPEEKSIETLFEEGVPISIHSAKEPSVDLRIEVLKEKGGYALYAVAPGRGQKKIGTIPALQAFRFFPEGFAVSPRATRLALILREDIDGPYSDYSAIGCSLTSGFKDLGLGAAGTALEQQ